MSNSSVVGPRKFMYSVDEMINPNPGHAKSLCRQNPPPGRISAWNLEIISGRIFGPPGAGLPGPGCVYHHPTAETFSADIYIHVQLSRVTSMHSDCYLFGKKKEKNKTPSESCSGSTTARRDLAVCMFASPSTPHPPTHTHTRPSNRFSCSLTIPPL